MALSPSSTSISTRGRVRTKKQSFTPTKEHYKLNKPRAASNKIDATARPLIPDNQDTDGGQVIAMNAAVYEIFKDALFEYYHVNSDSLTVMPKNRGSRSTADDLTIQECYQIVPKAGTKQAKKASQYTLNLFHTTCRILVNGNGLAAFTKHYQDTVDNIKQIDRQYFDALNELIKVNFGKYVRKPSSNLSPSTGSLSHASPLLALPSTSPHSPVVVDGFPAPDNDLLTNCSLSSALVNIVTVPTTNNLATSTNITSTVNSITTCICSSVVSSPDISSISHQSVHLPNISAAERNVIPRISSALVPRQQTGISQTPAVPLSASVVSLNSCTTISDSNCRTLPTSDSVSVLSHCAAPQSPLGSRKKPSGRATTTDTPTNSKDDSTVRLKQWEKKLSKKEGELKVREALITNTERDLAHSRAFVLSLEAKIKELENSNRRLHQELLLKSSEPVTHENTDTRPKLETSTMSPQIPSKGNDIIGVMDAVTRLVTEVCRGRTTPEPTPSPAEAANTNNQYNSIDRRVRELEVRQDSSDKRDTHRIQNQHSYDQRHHVPYHRRPSNPHDNTHWRSSRRDTNYHSRGDNWRYKYRDYRDENRYERTHVFEYRHQNSTPSVSPPTEEVHTVSRKVPSHINSCPAEASPVRTSHSEEHLSAMVPSVVQGQTDTRQQTTPRRAPIMFVDDLIDLRTSPPHAQETVPKMTSLPRSTSFKTRIVHSPSRSCDLSDDFLDLAIGTLTST